MPAETGTDSGKNVELLIAYIPCKYLYVSITSVGSQSQVESTESLVLVLTWLAARENHSIFTRSQMLSVSRNCQGHVAATATDVKTGNLL